VTNGIGRVRSDGPEAGIACHAMADGLRDDAWSCSRSG
jgi:hypothetical protein